MSEPVSDKVSPLSGREYRRVAVRVWDLPLRLFHWALVAAVAALIISGNVGGLWIDRHGQIGLLVLGLLVFRLVWGVIGSTYARFAAFVPTPGRLRAYLKGEWNGLGHNPLGALSVFALLGVLALQVVTGLFTTDDIAFQGPLYPLVGKDLSDTLTGLHRLLGNVLLALIGLHVAAIIFYQVVMKKNLVKPMLTGIAEAPEALNEPLRGGGWKAALVAVALAVAAVIGVTALAPAPPEPPPAGAVPDW